MRFAPARLPGLMLAVLMLLLHDGLPALAQGPALPSPSPSPSPTPSVSISGLARQGNPIFVVVRGVAPGTSATARWAGRSFPLSPASAAGEMRTVLPVPVDVRPELQALRIEGSEGLLIARSMRVQRRRFGQQYVQLPPAVLATYDTPRNREDDRRILEALAKFDPVRHWAGPFALPSQAPYSRNFGLRRLYNGWRKGWHKGLDIRAEEGVPVRAPAAGTVLHTARGITNGNTVVLGHGLGVGSVYLHLSRILVTAGQAVKKGDVIGRVGGTGGFAPHLHWEVRVHGVPVDPLSMKALPAGWR